MNENAVIAIPLAPPEPPSELTKLSRIIIKVLNRNLPRFLILIYSLDFLNESTQASQLYASVSILQTLLGTLNRGVITIGVSNNQKNPIN